MKITIEAEVKEIAALVKELEARKTVVSKINMECGCNTSVCEDNQGSSEVKQKAAGIKGRISDDTIKEVEKKFREYSEEVKKKMQDKEKEPGENHHIGIICHGMGIDKISKELSKMMAEANRGN